MDGLPELALRPGYPPPGGLPTGFCTLSQLADGRLHIDRADSRVLFSAELLAQAVINPAPGVTLTMAPGLNGTPFYDGALLKIEGVNRTVIYRMVEQVPAVHGYIGEWPD